MLQSSTINFLKNLAKNNNKPWFDEHRNQYLEAKTDFENFVSILNKKTAAFDNDVKELQVKDCVFRINRDIRFAKDKTPYKFLNFVVCTFSLYGKSSRELLLAFKETKECRSEVLSMPTAVFYNNLANLSFYLKQINFH